MESTWNDHTSVEKTQIIRRGGYAFLDTGNRLTSIHLGIAKIDVNHPVPIERMYHGSRLYLWSDWVGDATPGKVGKNAGGMLGDGCNSGVLAGGTAGSEAGGEYSEYLNKAGSRDPRLFPYIYQIIGFIWRKYINNGL